MQSRGSTAQWQDCWGGTSLVGPHRTGWLPPLTASPSTLKWTLRQPCCTRYGAAVSNPHSSDPRPCVLKLGVYPSISNLPPPFVTEVICHMHAFPWARPPTLCACAGARQVLLEGLLILALHNRPGPSSSSRGGGSAAGTQTTAGTQSAGGSRVASPGLGLGPGAVDSAVPPRQTQVFLLGALPLVLGALASPSRVAAAAGRALARLPSALGYSSVSSRAVQACARPGICSHLWGALLRRFLSCSSTSVQ